MSTSLKVFPSTQNIMNSRQDQMLFTKRNYPVFDLTNLKSNKELSKFEKFNFLLSALEKWNSIVARQLQPSICQMNKHEFIYSFLTKISLQGQPGLNACLQKVYEWYMSTYKKKQEFKVKQEDAAKSKSDEYQIRKSYKSNLPLEIKQYKRRIFADQQNLQKKNIQQLDALLEIKQIKSIIPSVSLKRQHSYLRGIREQTQIADSLTSFKKTQNYFQKSMTKRYLQGEFKRGKIQYPAKPTKVTKQFQQLTKSMFYSTDHIKDWRVHQRSGKRPFDQLNKNLTSAIYQPFKTMNGPFITSNCRQTTSQIPETPKYLENIQGCSLMQNPFDSKLKKKKGK